LEWAKDPPSHRPARLQASKWADKVLSVECRRVQVAQRILSVRKLREVEFSSTVLGEPGFDMLLTIYMMEASGSAACVDVLLPAAGAPPSVAARWLKMLHSEGLITSERGQTSELNAPIELTSYGRDKLNRFLDTVEGFVTHTRS
jgi:DNA-binding MarR family transcriptional regulator